MNPQDGTLYWEYDAGAGKFTLFTVVSETAGLVFTVVSQQRMPRETARWKAVINNEEVLALKLTDGTVAWRNRSLQKYAMGQMVYYKGYLGITSCSGTSVALTNLDAEINTALMMIDASNGKTLWVHEIMRKHADGSKERLAFEGHIYTLSMRNDKAYIQFGANLTEYDLTTGKWRYFQPEKRNHRCGKTVATPNYWIAGYGTWIDNNWNFQFKPVRRSGCATPLFPGYGMVYATPTGCRCYPMVNQGNGYIAFGASGGNKVVPDEWRLIPASPGWKENGVASPPTSVLRKSLISEDIRLAGTIMSDWPEFRSGSLTKRQSQGKYAFSCGEIIDYGSRLIIDIQRNGELLQSHYLGGRMSCKPVSGANAVYIGSRDGYVYCCNLENGDEKWRFLAAPLDRRAIVSSQLESQWPIQKIELNDTLLVVVAGLSSNLAGGFFHYGIHAGTGNILWKKREFVPSEGILSDPHRGFAVFEEMAPGGVPGSGPFARPSSYRYNVNPSILQRNGFLRIDFGPGIPVSATISIVDMKGRMVMREQGEFSRALKIPFSKFVSGKYFLVIDSGDKMSRKQITVARGT